MSTAPRIYGNQLIHRLFVKTIDRQRLKIDPKLCCKGAILADSHLAVGPVGVHIFSFVYMYICVYNIHTNMHALHLCACNGFLS